MNQRTAAQIGCSRRRFLQLTALAAGSAALGFPNLPAVRGANKKLNVGFIGLGGEGCVRLKEILDCDVNLAALCDVDEKQMSAAGEILAATPFAPQKYLDYRELLQHDLDAVVIATPDHWHAPIATAALKAGKHVFCEKPLTHSVGEARDLRRLAQQFPRLVTQMGNQGSASPNMRRAIELIQAGVIGEVREVHVWVPPSHSFKPGQSKPVGKDPIPTGLHWDAWLGPALPRPYKKTIYHPRAWRAWYDFGGGSMADWGCHGLNLPFRALKLDYPSRIEPDVPGKPVFSYPKDVRIRFDFAARGPLPPVTLWWYDGGRQPAAGVVPKSIVDYHGEMPDGGVLLLGEKGFTFGAPHPGADYIQLKGENKLSGILRYEPAVAVPNTLPRSPGHLKEWTLACAGGPPPFSSFEVGGHLTEIVQSGVVALRAGKALDWDGEKMCATNDPEADKYVRSEYRADWKI